MKWAHSIAENPDRVSLQEIESAITSKSKQELEDANLASAAEVLYFFGDSNKAKGLLEKAMKKVDSPKYDCLMGWIDLAQGRDQRSTQQLFESASSKGYPDGYVGRSRILQARHAAGEMKAVTKELTTAIYYFVPGHIERARSALVNREWNAAADVLGNALMNEGENAMAHFLLTICMICSTGSKIDSSIGELQSALDQTEKENHVLLHRIAAYLLPLCIRHSIVLTFCRNLLNQANQLSRKAIYLAEEMRVAIAMGDVKEVDAKARQLMEMDVADPYAALGMTISLLMKGKLNDAKVQFEFVTEAHRGIQSSPIYYFISAIISKQKKNSYEDFRDQTQNALDLIQSRLQGQSFGVDYLKDMDADLQHSISSHLLDYAPLVPTKPPADCLKRVDKILGGIIDSCPGLYEVAFLLARIRYLMCDNEGADQMLDLCLQKNEAVADAWLLKAQMKIDKGLVQDADASLNTGLNFNFALKQTSFYHLIKAKVFKKKDELDKAVEVLKAALKLPQKERNINLLLQKEATDVHRIAVQLELIDALQMMKNTIQPNQPNFQMARMKMAEIYLEHKKDKRMFTQCYRELLKSAQTASVYALLGDAYMNVQEPEKAIEMYEMALKMQNKDPKLTEKIGEAYVQCHLYTKAVNFYEATMNSTKDKRMRLKLAELLLKLGNLEKCEKVLRQPLDEDPNPIDAATIATHVQYLQLLATLHREKSQWQEAFDSLTKAKNLQLRLIQKSESPSSIQAKKEAAKICCSLAELYSSKRDSGKAVELYKEALTYSETDIKIHLALANIYLATNKLQLCNQQCQVVLSIERDNDEATLMMADLLYLKNEGEQAMVHFSQLLNRFPNHYHALARCIELYWRCGDVEAAEKYLKKALEANPRATIDAGYNYCKGLHEWYSGEPNAALQAFNRARRDLDWGEKAIYNMIEICLNPDNEIIGRDMGEHEEGPEDTDRAMGTKTAEKFLKELRYKPGLEMRYNLMENFIMVASRNKNDINVALNNLLSMIGPEDSVQNVGALLGAARAYLLQKQVPKAKAILKRVISHPWSIANADYLEKCWLLLTDLYISQSKPEQAAGVLRTILQHNQSSLKAYEYFGYLKEKEQKFDEAVVYYEEAWKLCKRRMPAIGFFKIKMNAKVNLRL
ncbi:hypothetical protein WR25_06129 isoform F [Diploscapter pachys]|uniref:Tetratricopeptide repeat protein 21B n=1 Tax=Diploscapter pachys TaxID=2018661 RepID=A0A2A2LDM3_9BILA|nr:hypothetical protein WR25_06129 isoform D [Diploscapter pachys]PAV84207.1 hypothetical protein WR25_06129 isoform F [Diploscapter pachys]